MLAVVLMALPMAASAAVEYTNWSEAAFEGTDTFYHTGVVAYVAGTTAKLESSVLNDTGYDVVVKSAKLNFDFGSYDAIAPTSFPVTVKNNDRFAVRFEFTVPADATNQVLHAYKVVIVYEKQDGPTTVNRVSWELANDLNLDQNGWISATLTLYDATPTAVNAIDVANYNEPDWGGVFTWKGTYLPSGSVYAKYEYPVQLAAGDGVNKIFYVALPANTVIDTTSVKICLVDKSTPTTKQGAPLTGGYSVTAEGKVTFDTAPEAWKTPAIFYKYYNVWTVATTGFAVYSADQAAAQALHQEVDELCDAADYLYAFDLQNSVDDGWSLGTWNDYNALVGAATSKAYGEAEKLTDEAGEKYAAGDFVGAKAKYEEAKAKFQEAISSQGTLVGGVEQGLTGLLTGAGGVIDGYGAKLDAEAKNITDTTKAEVNKLNGEADLAKNLGVFTILIGVAGLLAGIGGILWAYSRLVAAKGPKQI